MAQQETANAARDAVSARGAVSAKGEDFVAGADAVADAPPRPGRRPPGATRQPWYYELSPLVALDMGILVLFLVAMLYLMPTGQVADASFRIQYLERRIAHIERENQSLRMKIAQAGDLRAIEAAARKQYGMVPARFVHFAHVPASAQSLQAPQDGGVIKEQYPFSSRWDIVGNQFRNLFGGEARSDEGGANAP